MIITSNAPVPLECISDSIKPQGGSTPHIIDFFSARDRMIADQDYTAESFGNRDQKRDLAFGQKFLRPLCDPVEDWLQSLISGAALASLLIAILCSPSFTTSKKESSKPRAISQAESSLSAQTGIK